MRVMLESIGLISDLLLQFTACRLLLALASACVACLFSVFEPGGQYN